MFQIPEPHSPYPPPPPAPPKEGIWKKKKKKALDTLEAEPLLWVQEAPGQPLPHLAAVDPQDHEWRSLEPFPCSSPMEAGGDA